MKQITIELVKIVSVLLTETIFNHIPTFVGVIKCRFNSWILILMITCMMDAQNGRPYFMTTYQVASDGSQTLDLQKAGVTLRTSARLIHRHHFD